MKKLVLGLIAAATMATSAHAQMNVQYGTITSVIENWTYETRRVPYDECTTVRVPVIGRPYNGSNAGADALAGMIIGGILGKGLSGNDKGAAAGAVIGGVIGADRNNGHRPRHVGREYTEELRCFTKYDYIRESVVAGYTVQYMYEGHLYSFNTFKEYRIGDKIRLNVRVSPIN